MLPKTKNGETYNAEWRLRGDTTTGEYLLTVEYHSSLPPGPHEKMHRKLLEAARQWLLKRKIDPDDPRVQIRFERRARAQVTEQKITNNDQQKLVQVSTVTEEEPPPAKQTRDQIT